MGTNEAVPVPISAGTFEVHNRISRDNRADTMEEVMFKQATELRGDVSTCGGVLLFGIRTGHQFDNLADLLTVFGVVYVDHIFAQGGVVARWATDAVESTRDSVENRLKGMKFGGRAREGGVELEGIGKGHE